MKSTTKTEAMQRDQALAAQAELDAESAFVHKLSLIAADDDDKRRALQAELDAARANATAARCALAWAVEADIAACEARDKLAAARVKP